MSPEITPAVSEDTSSAGGRRASDKAPAKGGGTSIAEAVGAGIGAVSALAEKTQNHSMGIRGPTAVIANLTAVAFVCGMFFFMFREWAAGQREERLMMYNQLRDQRDSDAKRNDSNSTDLRALATEVRAGNELTRSNNELTRTLIQRIDMLISIKQQEDRLIPVPRAKPSPPGPTGNNKDGEKDAFQKHQKRGMASRLMCDNRVFVRDVLVRGHADSR